MLCLLIFSLVCIQFCNAAPEIDPPNFVIINIDDLGYADIGPFGSTLNRTPHLDRMAAEGMKLKCHYAAPVCSPSRSALMTGCYPKRVLPIQSVLFPASAVGLNPEETTLAEVLKAKGYATACIGKWHLGDQPQFLPTNQGFDSYFGIPYSNDMGPASEGSKSDLGVPLPNSKEDGSAAAGDETGRRGNSQPPLPLLRNNRVVERVGPGEQQTITERYTNEAISFIQANQSKPFFLYLPHNAVHFPLYPSVSFHKKSKNGLIGDWIEEVDANVGRVLDELRRLKLDTKTLVVFTSDNGGTPRSVNTPLRGHKASTWEGGMRVPTIAWWPGRIPAGTATNEITSMMDMLPTFTFLAKASLPDKPIDGKNIWSLLAGQNDVASGYEAFYYFRGLKLEAVRRGKWKLQISGNEKAGNATGKGKTKNTNSDAEPYPRLYNLEDDLGEKLNVAASHPDIVAELSKFVDKMKLDLGTDGIGPGCRPLGRVESPKPLINSDGTFRSID